MIVFKAIFFLLLIACIYNRLQIYGDGDRHLDAGAGKNRDKWSNRFKIGLDILKDVPKEQWISKKEVICIQRNMEASTYCKLSCTLSQPNDL